MPIAATSPAASHLNPALSNTTHAQRPRMRSHACTHSTTNGTTTPLCQVERQHLKAETRRYTNEITRYHTPGEWEKIDSILDDIGDYAAIDKVSGTRAAVRLAGLAR